MPAVSSTQPIRQLEEPYRLDDITRTKAPDGGVGQDWFCYTITQGHNTITGYRHGGQRAVTKAIKEIVFELNARRNGKKGRVHLTPSRRAKKN